LLIILPHPTHHPPHSPPLNRRFTRTANITALEGFHKTTFPTIAGAVGRLPPIE